MKKKKNGAAKEAASPKKRIVVIAAVSAIAALLIIAAGALQIMGDSSFFMQEMTAASLQDAKLSPAEYNFYYYRAYLEFINTMGGSNDMMESDIPFDSKLLSDMVMKQDENGKDISWEDFFTSRADALIEHTYLYYDLAMKNGFEVTQELLDQIEYEFGEKVWFEAEELSQSSIDTYLRNNFGQGMTQELFKEHLTKLYVANAYSTQCKANVPIPTETLDAYYQDYAEECAVVKYRAFYLSGKGDTEAEKKENMRKAKALADSIAAQSTDEETFTRLCRENMAFNASDSFWKGESVVRRNQLRYSLSHIRRWMSETSPKLGDVQAFEATNGYYVLMFLGSNDNSSPSVNLRYFTVSGEDALFNAKRFAEIFATSPKTPELFFSMSEDIRDVDYTIPNYYLASSISYQKQTSISVPECMQDWCFAQSRSVGDVQWFQDESGKIYVAYFEGYGDLCSRVIAANDLREEYFARWETENVGTADVKHNTFFFLTRKL